MGKAAVAVAFVFGLASPAFAEDAKPYPVLARIAEADRLVQKGELTRAKTAFIRLHKISAGETRTSIATRIGAINQTLQLPSTDGLVTAATPAAIAPTTSDSLYDSLYDQARDAFDQADYMRALTLAQKAARNGSVEAKILYGDSLFRLADYKRAKVFYIALFHRTTGATKYSIAKKVAAANGRLRLPMHDGLPSDPLLDLE